MTFFAFALTPTAEEASSWVGGELAEGSDAARVISGIAPLQSAGPDDLSFLDNRKYAKALADTKAGVVLVSAEFADSVPVNTTGIVVAQPYHAYASIVARLIPDSIRPAHQFSNGAQLAHIHPEATINEGVECEPGVVIGPGAEIGSGTLLGANAVIGRDVKIGRDCVIGANCTISNALLGDKVIIHPGTSIGQDGFGFALSPNGHQKVPQIGRVIIQDSVEIGSNTSIDRGTNQDTVIGEGAKIDNLVQIAHNVKIGCHAVIVSQVGISGSSTLGNFGVLAGKVGVSGHVSIGDGAQVLGGTNVKDDIPPGEKWGSVETGRPLKEAVREKLLMRKAIKKLFGK